MPDDTSNTDVVTPPDGGTNPTVQKPTPPPAPTGNKTGESEDGKKFSQEYVNSLATKARREGSESQLKKLGFEDWDTVAQVVKAHQEQENANKTELEKALADLEKIKKELSGRDETIAKMQSAQKTERLSNAIVSSARVLGAKDADEIAKLTMLESSVIEGFYTDEKLDKDKIKSFLEDHQKNKPYLYEPKKQGAGSPSHNDGKDSDIDPNTDEIMKRARKKLKKYRA